MDLKEKLVSLCARGFPFREAEITDTMVQGVWHLLSTKGITPHRYYIDLFLEGSKTLCPPDTCLLWQAEYKRYPTYLERSHSSALTLFLNAQELQPVLVTAKQLPFFCGQLREAFDLIAKIPAMASDVDKLVRSIVILQSLDEDYDHSYSHPSIPFSIFVSTGIGKGVIRNIRTAESIVHEAMHLKLSLIEQILPLVKHVRTEAMFYSPWKFEMRPLQGMIHALYVFKMLYIFYHSLLQRYGKQDLAYDFICERINDIKEEIRQVNQIDASDDLTVEGRLLVQNLLQIELT